MATVINNADKVRVIVNLDEDQIDGFSRGNPTRIIFRIERENLDNLEYIVEPIDDKHIRVGVKIWQPK